MKFCTLLKNELLNIMDMGPFDFFKMDVKFNMTEHDYNSIAQAHIAI